MFKEYTKALAEKARNEETIAAEDYIADDGRLYCGKCNTPKESSVIIEGVRPPCICECKKRKLIEEELERKRTAYRQDCFSSPKQYAEKFENDRGYNPKITAALIKYVDNFETFKKSGIGILMYGSFGTGKTFHANCVANALIDKGFRVKATQFEELYRLEQVTKNKADFFTTLSRYALVVLDDLGAEKNNSSMRSFVFTVIDTLYKSKTPFIITTNLSIEEIKSPSESENRRIYERILERCPCPISVERPEGSIRLQRVRETHADYKRMLGLE